MLIARANHAMAYAAVQCHIWEDVALRSGRGGQGPKFQENVLNLVGGGPLIEAIGPSLEQYKDYFNEPSDHTLSWIATSRDYFAPDSDGSDGSPMYLQQIIQLYVFRDIIL